MQCVTLVVVVLLLYIFYQLYDYHIDDKFETFHQNPIAERFFDDNVKVYVINLLQNENRMNYMREQFDKQKISFTRVIAPDINLENKKFIDEWSTMPGDEYKGTKGLYLSNIKTMQMSLEQKKPWVLVLEDDVKITKNFKEKVYNILRNNNTIKVYNLDKLLFRNNLTSNLTMSLFTTLGHTGTNMYKKDVLPEIIKELYYPTSEYIKKFKQPAVYDQYLYWMLRQKGIKFMVVPLNKKDVFASTIATSHHRGRIPFANQV